VTGEKHVVTRVCDLQHAVSAVSGKVELVLEGEQEGAQNVARALLGRGVKAVFNQKFPDAFKPKRARGRGASAPPADDDETRAAAEYRPVLEWFAGGQNLSIGDDMPAAAYAAELSRVKGLSDLAAKYLEPANADEHAVAMELVLEGLHQSSMLSRERSEASRTEYKDMLKSMLSGMGDD
jgi:magnesium chelatase subunit I